jgi:hypothetical protein
MILWDKISNIQDFFKKKSDVVESPAHNKDGKLNFGIVLDIAKRMPVNPGSFATILGDAKNALTNAKNNIPSIGYNDAIEKARVKSLETLSENATKPTAILAGAATGAAIGTALPVAGTAAGGIIGAGIGGASYTMAELDKVSDGKVSNALMSGTKGIRSNYAFLREAADADIGLGLLAGLGQIGGALAGGAAAIGAGALAGSVVPGVGTVIGGLGAAGAVLGAYAGGKATRSAAQSGALGEELRQAAVAAQSPEGQEKYNFGRDVTRIAGKVSGIKQLQETDKGIGAITSGVVNIFTEGSVAPEVKGIQLTARGAKGALVGGIEAKSQGYVADVLQKRFDTPEAKRVRLEKDIDLIKRTAAGEETAYTPIFEFYNKSDIATAKMRVESRLGDDMAQTSASLMAGKSYEEISLILRVGRGEEAAVEELSKKHASTYAQLLRAEGKLQNAEVALSKIPKGNLAFDGESKILKKSAKDKVKILEAELNDYRTKYAELDRALTLDTQLLERTTSVIPYVEKLRNDVARQKAANKFGVNKIEEVPRETLIGSIRQTVWQSNPLGATVRLIERFSDDAPHSTVNFNDVIQSTTRMRTTLRAGVEKGLLTPEESIDLFNKFAGARSEGKKLDIIKDLTKKVHKGVAVKYDLDEASMDMIMNNYIFLMEKTREKAKTAAAEQKAFMIDESGEIIRDAQLVSQLANGSYLPDVELIDAAFKRFAKKNNDALGVARAAGVKLKVGYDDVQSVWRTFTLLRTGYPINIIRDSTFRVIADGQLFYVLKNLGKNTIDDLANSANTPARIERWTKSAINKESRIKEVRKELNLRANTLTQVEKNLKKLGYDFNKPPKKIRDDVQRTLDHYNQVKRNVDALLTTEAQLLGKIPGQVVGKNSFVVSNYAFDGAFGGLYGKISMQKIRGKDDIRALLASNRELDVAILRRDRQGGSWVIPTIENRELHLKSWENVLVNQLPTDPVAMAIMKGNSKAKVIKLIKSEQLGTYVDRFGFDPKLKRELRRSDAEYIYERVNAAVNQFAPDLKLQKMVAEGKVNALELEKMFPDVTKRPGVNSDLALDLLGQSGVVRNMNDFTKDVVAWLAVQPASKLVFNPYFRARYEQRIQSMVAVANATGRKLSESQIKNFDAGARAFAMKELRTKLNGFNRDMNYPGLFNYVFSFFPAIVEQFRVYGRLAMENPEFPYRVNQMMNIPEQITDVKIDEYGEQYVEVTLPIFGGDVKARMSPQWFNPLNPTGGYILSSTPVVAAATNEILKNSNTELSKWFEDAILPFGVQSNSANILLPTTIRRLGQAFSGFVKSDSPQLNKDTAMLLTNELTDFKLENHRMPTSSEFAAMVSTSGSRAKWLAVARFLGSTMFPQQPRYVTPLQVYSDLLGKYTEEFGQDGAAKFVEDYPDYFLIADKLTDSVSGLNSDRNAATLAQNNPRVVEQMVSAIGDDGDLTVLGAVFNDDDYAFSSSAQAWLTTNTIPGTRKKFKDQQSALENARSSIVKKGWSDWNLLIETVTQAVESNNPPYDPTTGYGKAVLDGYKEAFIQSMKEQNPMWYAEKQDKDFQSKINNTVDVLTIAANNENMWKDLSKQARWHSIVEYLNYRYYVNDELKVRGYSYTSDKAWDLRQETERFVYQLRKEDINFGKFYDRYFTNDDFSYINE